MSRRIRPVGSEMGGGDREFRFTTYRTTVEEPFTRMNRPRPVNAENEKKEARLRLLPQCYPRLVHSP